LRILTIGEGRHCGKDPACCAEREKEANHFSTGLWRNGTPGYTAAAREWQSEGPAGASARQQGDAGFEGV
jgi:hypothetical protein